MQFGPGGFLEYYEAAHQHGANRIAHHCAHTLAIAAVPMLVFDPKKSLGLIAVAFFLSWSGHFLFEKNTPAFFETEERTGKWETAGHSITVAVGGVVWSLSCFLKVLRLERLAKRRKNLLASFRPPK